MKKNKIYFILSAIVLASTVSITTLASNGTADNLKSSGRLVFDNDTEDISDDVIFDASDLVYLAGKADDLLTYVQW